MVVNKALEFDPDKRYQTPSDMLVDLKLAIKRVKTAAEGGKVAGAELESNEGLDDQGQPRKLMIVESDVKMQDTLRELFKKNGYRVLVSGDPNRVLSRFFDDNQAADLILFTTSNNGRTALGSVQPLRPGIADARPAGRAAAGPGPSATGPTKRRSPTTAWSPRCRSRCASCASCWSRSGRRKFLEALLWCLGRRWLEVAAVTLRRSDRALSASARWRSAICSSETVRLVHTISVTSFVGSKPMNEL